MNMTNIHWDDDVTMNVYTSEDDYPGEPGIVYFPPRMERCKCRHPDGDPCGCGDVADEHDATGQCQAEHEVS